VDGLAPRLLGPLGLVELELPVIHDPADGRVRERSNLNEIEVELAGDCESVGQGLNSELLTIGIDEPYFAGADSVVYPDLAGGGGDAVLLLLGVLAVQDRCQKRRPHSTHIHRVARDPDSLRRPGGGS
jgi:hypothetical protein